MAGIEDFVVEQIVNDFRDQVARTPQVPLPQPSPLTLEQAIKTGNMPAQAQLSPFLAEAQYAGQMRSQGMPEGAVADPRAPRGFTIADPALRDKYAMFEGRQNAAATTGAALERAMKERDQQRMQVLQAVKGLAPEIQSTILRRLGIDAGKVKTELEQQKELAQFKQQLEQPQQEVLNAIRMLTAQRQLQQGEQELGFKERQLAAETAGRGETRNLQMMRFLATMMQSDPTGKLASSIGPLLMQLMQDAGIKLAPPAGAQKPKITRVD